MKESLAKKWEGWQFVLVALFCFTGMQMAIYALAALFTNSPAAWLGYLFIPSIMVTWSLMSAAVKIASRA